MLIHRFCVMVCLTTVWSVALALAALADQAPEPLTIATWNLEWFFDEDQQDNRSNIAKEQSSPTRQEWEWKRDVVAEAISKFRPTILALQEIENRYVLQELTRVLREKYGLTYRVAFIEGFDSATEQDVAFLYQSGLVEFSRREQTKEQFDSMAYYNLSKHLFARFQWQADGRTESMLILTAHFRAKPEEHALRLRQSKLVRLWLDAALKAGENVVFLGDLNIEEACCDPVAGGEMHQLLGKHTTEIDDDMVEVLQQVPAEKRRTHLILDTQYDRILVSPSLIADAPGQRDLVLTGAEVLGQHCIRGTGPDADHWDTRFTKDKKERDISDHFPVMATFRFQ